MPRKKAIIAWFGMVTCACALIAVSISLFHPHRTFAQQQIELACPSGTVALTPLTTVNPQTGALRQYGCINAANGQLIFQDTAAASGGFQGVNSQSGTTYTALQSDNNKLIVFTNNSGTTLTLPATPPPAPWSVTAVNAGTIISARLGITGNGNTINGVSGHSIFIGEEGSATIFSTGAAYFALLASSAAIDTKPAVTYLQASGQAFQMLTSGASAANGSIWNQMITQASTFSSLPTVTNGALYGCSDCTSPSNPCTGSGTGAVAVGQGGAWVCK